MAGSAHPAQARLQRPGHAPQRRSRRDTGDPDRGAVRADQPHRSTTAATQTRPQGPAGASDHRVHGYPRFAVRDPTRVGAGQESTAAGDGSRTGRDHPAVGAHRGTHRTRVARTGGRAAAETQLFGAALVVQFGRRGRLREGHAARGADRRRAPGGLRPDRRAHRPADLHPLRAGRGAVESRRHPREARLSAAQPGRAARGRGCRRPHPAARHARRRSGDLRLLRRAAAVRGHLRGQFRRLVAQPPRPVLPRIRPQPAHRRGRSGRGTRRLPRSLGCCRVEPARELRLRARRRTRRGECERPAGTTQPAASRAVQLAGARVTHRARHRTDPASSQAGAHQLRAGTRPRPRGAGLAGRAPAGPFEKILR